MNAAGRDRMIMHARPDKTDASARRQVGAVDPELIAWQHAPTAFMGQPRSGRVLKIYDRRQS